jgi:hypothetical protein
MYLSKLIVLLRKRICGWRVHKTVFTGPGFRYSSLHSNVFVRIEKLVNDVSSEIRFRFLFNGNEPSYIDLDRCSIEKMIDTLDEILNVNNDGDDPSKLTS